MSNHIAGEILAAFVDGTLPVGTRQGVESHLSRCPECRRDLADVVEIRNSRVQVPAEFLNHALKAVPPRSDAVPNKGTVEPIGVPARKALPLRLAFGVAAVLLVAVTIRYLFLGRGRADRVARVEKQVPELAVALERGQPPAAAAEAMPAGANAAVPGHEAQAGAGSDLNAEKKLAVAEASPGPFPPAPSSKAAGSMDSPKKEERPRTVASEDEALSREVAGGVIGGVLGGLETTPEKDKVNATKEAAPVASAVAAEEPGKDGVALTLQDAAPTQAKGGVPEKWKAPRSRFSGSATAANAMQLFLAASGRASAPRMLPAEAHSPRLPVVIRGDVREEDLLEPWTHAGWAWLPAGAQLQVTIAADGSVSTVELLGRWETDAAAQARTAAGKLLFSASARKVRRAVLLREPLN